MGVAFTYFRRIVLLAFLLLALGTISCRVTKTSAKRIILPSEEEIALIELTDQIANKVGVELSLEEDNIGLYAFVADWIGTPYRFGANTRKGTDCSGFVQRLYQEVYHKEVGRTSSAALMERSTAINRNELREGDMVFFNINNRTGGRASHVGVYLKAGKFAHATTQNGVIVSHLSEPYYRRTYIGAGRILRP